MVFDGVTVAVDSVTATTATFVGSIVFVAPTGVAVANVGDPPFVIGPDVAVAVEEVPVRAGKMIAPAAPSTINSATRPIASSPERERWVFSGGVGGTCIRSDGLPGTGGIVAPR